MRRFKFQKPLVENPIPPENTNVLWVDVNENDGKVASIKEFINNSWEIVLSKPESTPK